jgi:hypothetical protein
VSIVPKRASLAFAASLKASTFFYQPEQLHCTQFLLQFSVKIKPRKIQIKYSNSSKIRTGKKCTECEI